MLRTLTPAACNMATASVALIVEDDVARATMRAFCIRSAVFMRKRARPRKHVKS